MPIRSRLFKRYVLSYFLWCWPCAWLWAWRWCGRLPVSCGRRRRRSIRPGWPRPGDYIERQLSAMEDIRLDVKTRLQFQPFYLTRQKTNEFELLDAFARYASFSPWIEEYYLWYQDAGRVFSTRSAYSERVFFQQIMNGLPPEQLTAALPAAGSILFQVPGHSARRADDCAAVLFRHGPASHGTVYADFSGQASQLRQTIWQVTGQERGSGFALEYEGQTMLST